MNWTEQAGKIKLRVQHIQHAGAPMKLNIHTYNTRVVPVPNYVAQLLPIPEHFFQLERAMLHTVFRSLQNSFCHADFSTSAKLGVQHADLSLQPQLLHWSELLAKQ